MSTDSSWHDMVIGRLDHHSERLVKLEEGDVMLKQRVSNLERDRESVREMVAMIGKLGEKTDKAIDAVDEIAERAVAKVLRVRSEDRKLRLKHNIAILAASCTAMGAGLGFANLVFHLIHF